MQKASERGNLRKGVHTFQRMLMVKAVLGSTVFFFAAPCVVGGVLPWWISGWSAPRFWPGLVIVAAGAFVVLRAFVRFVREGRGTPAPVAPTEQLVVGGDYRFVRNPMYEAVAAPVGGRAVILGRPGLLLYAAVFVAAVAAFVLLYEEPELARQFGDEYDAY